MLGRIVLNKKRQLAATLGASDPSKVDGNYMSSVNTPVNIDILHLWLKDHPDKEFVSYLINGLQFGFHTGFQTIPETPFECKNLRSAEKHSECVRDLIQQEVNKGKRRGNKIQL